MSLIEKKSYPVFYMFAITFVATGILIGLSRFTSDRVEANRQVFFERAVLGALGWQGESEMSPVETHKAFSENVAEPTESSAGAYRLMRDGSTAAYALPFEGRGFWDEIKGVIGIKPDGSTLTGVSFYQQKETPGLGAEIVKPYFTDQFDGLNLSPAKPVLSITKAGTKTGNSEVDAVTGATQTCTRLEDILNDAIAEWLKQMELSSGVKPDNSPGEAQ